MSNYPDLIPIVKTYLELKDNGQVDEALELVTDKFRFKFTHGSTIIEGDKQRLKSFYDEVTQKYTDFRTTIKSAVQNDDIVRITATTKYKALLVGPDSQEYKQGYDGKWEFVKQKIKYIEAKNV